MAKCEHGVYRKEYCQVCTPGCGGGIYVPPPISDEELQKTFCIRCLSTKVAFDFQNEHVFCLECGYDLKLSIR